MQVSYGRLISRVPTARCLLAHGEVPVGSTSAVCPLPESGHVKAVPLPRPARPERDARPLPTAAEAALLPAGRALPYAAARRGPASAGRPGRDAGLALPITPRPLCGGPRAERGGAAGGTAGLEAARGPAAQSLRAREGERSAPEMPGRS